jgi:hypothetical protein
VRKGLCLSEPAGGAGGDRIGHPQVAGDGGAGSTGRRAFNWPAMIWIFAARATCWAMNSRGKFVEAGIELYQQMLADAVTMVRAGAKAGGLAGGADLAQQPRLGLDAHHTAQRYRPVYS